MQAAILLWKVLGIIYLGGFVATGLVVLHDFQKEDNPNFEKLKLMASREGSASIAAGIILVLLFWPAIVAAAIVESLGNGGDD